MGRRVTNSGWVLSLYLIGTHHLVWTDLRTYPTEAKCVSEKENQELTNPTEYGRCERGPAVFPAEKKP